MLKVASPVIIEARNKSGLLPPDANVRMAMSAFLSAGETTHWKSMITPHEHGYLDPATSKKLSLFDSKNAALLTAHTTTQLCLAMGIEGTSTEDLSETHDIIDISDSDNETEVITLDEDAEPDKTAPDLQETSMTDQDDDTLILMAEVDPELTVGKVQEQPQPPSVSNSDSVFAYSDIRCRDKTEKKLSAANQNV